MRLALFALALLCLTASAQRSPVEPRRAHERERPSTIEIGVVDLEGRPLREAQVRFALEDATDSAVRDPGAPLGLRQGMRFERPPLSGQVEPALRARTWAPVGPGGRFSLDWPPARGLLVEGRQGQRWGYAWFPRDWRETAGRAHPEGEPLRLELAPDWDLRVRVEDARGRPLTNVGVSLWSPEGIGGRRARSDREELVLRHVGFDTRRARQVLALRVEALLDPPLEAHVDPRRPPDEPIRMRLPPTGEVEVSVHGEDGLPVQRPTPVALSFQGADAGVSTRLYGLTLDGVARFEHVALGRELCASLQSSPSARVVFAGPTWPQQVVTAALERTAPPTPEPEAAARPEAAGLARASFGGHLLLDPGVPTDGIEVRVGELSRWSDSARVERDGGFRFPAAQAGSARLQIWPRAAMALPERERPVVFQAGLELAPGENELPALASIDLRGKLFAHTLRLRGLDSGPALRAGGLERARTLRACVLFGPSSWPASLRCRQRFSSLPFVLTSAWRAVDAEVYVPGYRALDVRDLGAEREVALEPGLVVELRLASPAVLPAPPRGLAAALVPEGCPLQVLDWRSPLFDAQGRLETTAFRPGRNRVVWIVRSDSGGSAFEAREPQRVEVTDTPRLQVFPLELPDELARRLAE